MTPIFITKHRLLIIGLLVVAFVIIPVTYFIFNSKSQEGKTKVTLISVPDDATITINDNPTRTGTIFLEPGIYTIKAQKNGFRSVEQKETVGNESRAITLSLAPTSDEAKKWAEQNKTKYLQVEGEGGREASRLGSEIRGKNPIINDLPYSSLLYTIGYQSDNDDPTGNSIIVTIDAPQGFRNAAVKQIRDMGYDPATLNIKFRFYESPFK